MNRELTQVHVEFIISKINCHIDRVKIGIVLHQVKLLEV